MILRSANIEKLANLSQLSELTLRSLNVVGDMGALKGLAHLTKLQLQHTDVLGCKTFKFEHSSVECDCP
jgi:hypothetical protein